MNLEQSYHMSPEEFRRHGHALIDWIADYQQRVESFPVLSQVQPGEIRAALPSHPPQRGEAFDAMLADVDNIIMPGITHWQSPNFFAFFPSNNSGPSILGDLLSAGLGVQGMLWLTSPACTELETHVMDWLVEMMGLPAAFLSTSDGGGVIQESASNAALCALLAARERASGYAVNQHGGTGQITAYCTAHTHSSIEKAMMIAGLGRENLRLVAVDADFAMRPDELAAAIALDKAAGLTPAFVCTNVGSTSSNAIDPVRAIGEVCRAAGVWLHVDAAMAGTATVCPEFRWIIDGLELADSYCFNPHKWMFTNFDCDAFFVADRAALINTLSILPEYLRNQATASGAVIDYRDWQISLGRRFRALKLWFVIRHYGVEGLQYHIRKHVAMAQEFAQWVADSPDFELAAPAPLNLVCLRHKGGDEVNQAVLSRLNAVGELYITHTKLDGRYTLRMSIGQSHTEPRHVARAWEKISATAQEVAAELTAIV
jgi:aromatic-L-amino-acid decarboxylase